jgi:dTDP-4-amino-4,6-dideoxygalactose transaminase/protein-tyrosine-phosphatase
MSFGAGRFCILFVCTANACRSAIAERACAAGLRARLGAGAARFHVASAGTAGLDGRPLHPYTAEALSQIGASADGFVSHALTLPDVDRADLILTAGREHRDHVVAMRPGASRRTYLLREFARLAARAPAAGGNGDPVERARGVVAGVAPWRGRVPYVDPAEHEIADPVATTAAFADCARLIQGAVAAVLDALCGPPAASAHPSAAPAGHRGAQAGHSPAAGARGPRRRRPAPAAVTQAAPEHQSRRVPLAMVAMGAEEEDAVLGVLRSGNLAGGARVEELECSFARAHEAAHAVAVSSGTAALVAALRAHDIGAGDEVITSPLTFVATLNAILEVGATARFADIGDDLTLDPSAVAALVTPRTKVVMPVHLYGLPAPMPRIRAIAREHGLVIIEDAAQAHGARVARAPVGSSGTATFSLYATKNITCGEGGIVTTDDDRIAARLRLLRNHGMRERYDYSLPGYNYRLTDLQAAIATVQLARLSRIGAARCRNATVLSGGLAGLRGLVLPAAPADRLHAWHQYTVQVTQDARMDRDQLRKCLDVAGIDARPYYPKLVHDYPCYLDHPQVVSDETPRARRAVGQVLSLPVHPGLTDADIGRIVSCVRAALA